MSWYGWLNFLLIQWFFVRLTKCIDDETNKVSWKLTYLVLPLTGWWSDYVFLYRGFPN